MLKTTLSWSDRFALINHYAPTDDQICIAFSLNQAELDTARMLASVGTFKPSLNLDVAKYANVFTSGVSFQPPLVVKKGGPASFMKPESATKRTKIPQKRGRKGNKIEVALRAVPTYQVPVAKFMAEQNISLAVLRQSRRFMQRMDPQEAASIGSILVRQGKTSKELMIWREPPKA